MSRPPSLIRFSVLYSSPKEKSIASSASGAAGGVTIPKRPKAPAPPPPKPTTASKNTPPLESDAKLSAGSLGVKGSPIDADMDLMDLSCLPPPTSKLSITTQPLTKDPPPTRSDNASRQQKHRKHQSLGGDDRSTAVLLPIAPVGQAKVTVPQATSASKPLDRSEELYKWREDDVISSSDEALSVENIDEAGEPWETAARSGAQRSGAAKVKQTPPGGLDMAELYSKIAKKKSGGSHSRSNSGGTPDEPTDPTSTRIMMEGPPGVAPMVGRDEDDPSPFYEEVLSTRATTAPLGSRSRTAVAPPMQPQTSGFPTKSTISSSPIPSEPPPVPPIAGRPVLPRGSEATLQQLRGFAQQPPTALPRYSLIEDTPEERDRGIIAGDERKVKASSGPSEWDVPLEPDMVDSTQSLERRKSRGTPCFPSELELNQALSRGSQSGNGGWTEVSLERTDGSGTKKAASRGPLLQTLERSSSTKADALALSQHPRSVGRFQSTDELCHGGKSTNSQGVYDQVNNGQRDLQRRPWRASENEEEEDYPAEPTPKGHHQIVANRRSLFEKVSHKYVSEPVPTPSFPSNVNAPPAPTLPNPQANIAELNSAVAPPSVCMSGTSVSSSSVSTSSVSITLQPQRAPIVSSRQTGVSNGTGASIQSSSAASNTFWDQPRADQKLQSTRPPPPLPNKPKVSPEVSHL